MSSMIDDLLDPEALPERTGTVSLIQTHISLVFVADAFVYKVKKAVNFGFLDFSTLEKRRHYCQQEIILNRRLSKGLYMDVLPILFDGNRHRMGQGSGEVVEYAVKMKKIPENMLMRSLYEHGRITDEHLQRVACVLARFHSDAERSPEIDRFGEPRMFKINTDENFEQTRPYIGMTIEKGDFDSLREWTEGFYREKEGLFHDRIQAEKIRDCHGDLHMEHVYLGDPIAFFDCIEFNDRFRYTDILADIGFLLMDLEYRGGDDLADRLWRFYTDITGDRGMESLLNFYKVYRAYVRGKVNSFQIDDPRIGSGDKEEIIKTARNYFRLARRYIDETAR